MATGFYTRTEEYKKNQSEIMKRAYQEGKLHQNSLKNLTNRWPKGHKAWNKGLKNYNSGEKHWFWGKHLNELTKKFGFQKGKENPNYKNGLYTLENLPVYRHRTTSFIYKKWRQSVFERDNYECKSCGFKGYITAHHIKSWAKYPELRYEVNNGLTLCEPCHSLTDNYKGRGKK